MTKKAAPKSKEPTQKRLSSVSTTNVSGGVNVDADEVEVKGDVVGHDKIEVEPGAIVVGRGGRLMQVVINLPRSVQIAVAVVALAIVIVIAKALMPSGSKVNTEFVFDASAAMSDPERWRIAQTVFGDQATYATRREQLALRKVGGGCDVPRDPLVPLGANQADRLVSAVKSLKPIGDAALVESIKTAADDLPSGADTQNSIILISAGQDTCLTKQQKDPCTAMSAVAEALNRAGIKFTLHIVALRADEAARQQLTCLARANATGYVYEANSVDDLKNVLGQIEKQAVPTQVAVVPTATTQAAADWPVVHTVEISEVVFNLSWSSDGGQILVRTPKQLLAWDLASDQIHAQPISSDLQTGLWSHDRSSVAYVRKNANGIADVVVQANGAETVLKLTSQISPTRITYLAWSPDGQQISAASLAYVAGKPDAKITIWNVASKAAQTFSGHTDYISAIVWSPDGKKVASGSWDGTIRLWDTVGGQALQVFKDACCNTFSLTWSPDSRQLAASGESKSGVYVWDVSSGQLSATISTERLPGVISWSPNGPYIVTGGYELIDMRNQRNLGFGHLPDTSVANPVSSIAWSPDSAQLAISSEIPSTGNYAVHVWQVPH